MTAVGLIVAAPASFAHTFFGPVPHSIQAATSGLTIGVGSLSQNYKERINGSIFDKEAGHLGYVGITWGFQHAHLGGTFSMSDAGGNTRYTGAILTNPPIPLTATTGNHIFNIAYNLHYGFSPMRHLAIISGAFIGRNIWNRNIKGTTIPPHLT